MLRSINNVNSDSPEVVIELNEANPSGSQSQNKVNVSNIDFALERKTERNGRNILSTTGEKDSSSEIYENSETLHLLYPSATIRLSKMSSATLEEQAEAIVNKIERKKKLIKTDPVSELLRLEMIRNMPQNLTLKRSVKARLSLSVDQNSKKRPIGYWKKLKYRTSMSISQIKSAVYHVGSSLGLWQQAIKVIEGHFGSGIASYFKLLRWLFIINAIGCVFSISFITLPQALLRLHQNENFSTKDLFLGNGFFTNSIFYYGFYTNSTLLIDPKTAYDMPTAYFSTFLFCYIFTFILLCFKVAQSYRKCFIETSSGVYNRYANKIFCSWDWGISSSKAVSLRSASIYRELQELLSETKNVSAPVSCSMKFWTLLIRVAMTTLIFTVMCGIVVLLWLLLAEYKTDGSNDWSALRVPLAMTIIINLLPPLLSWSVKYEKYSRDRIAFYITMLRAFAIAIIAVATTLTFELTQSLSNDCWQTRLAQDVYRLIVLDLIASLLVTFVFQAARSALREYLGPPRFDMASSALSLIYNQSLFWLVHYFSPPMSILVIVKLFLTFYVKKFELLRFCEPPSRYWLAAQTQTLFLALVFLGMLCAVLVLGFVVIYVDTSACGPFAGRSYTWEIVVEKVLRVRRDSEFWNFLGSIANPATGVAILVAMCVAVYYLRAKAEASRQMVNILRDMLVWQARDKKFLLKTFSSANNENSLRHRPTLKATATDPDNITDSTRDRTHASE
ncbi:transmembrane channel-like protein 3 [Copidosoma floridanum]|uniref:transmembrane channel-like protein 3 n=1 Tax=Copidosoma floridanum TaxID=29053 RepID=UPI0006C9B027|nr:transmembrane channel-like protein 3 [Copidosoma floridanum]